MITFKNFTEMQTFITRFNPAYLSKRAKIDLAFSAHLLTLFKTRLEEPIADSKPLVNLGTRVISILPTSLLGTADGTVLLTFLEAKLQISDPILLEKFLFYYVETNDYLMLVRTIKAYDSAIGSKGAALKIKNEKGETLLRLSLKKGHEDIISQLILEEGDINQKDSENVTRLHRACKRGDAELALALLKRGASADEGCKSGITPLHWACAYNQENVVSSLIDKNASVNARTNLNETPLHWVIKYKSSGQAKLIMDLLLKNGAKIDLYDNQGWTPLTLALILQARENSTFVDFLKENGGDADLAHEILFRITAAHKLGMGGVSHIKDHPVALEGNCDDYLLKTLADDLAAFQPCEEELIETLNGYIKSHHFIEHVKEIDTSKIETTRVLISGGFNFHVITFECYKDEIRIFNRGNGCRQRGDRVCTSVYKHARKLNKKELNDLMLKFCTRYPTLEAYNKMLSDLTAGPDPILSLEEDGGDTQKRQKVGNCSLASPKAWIRYSFIRIYGKELGLKIYKQFSAEIRRKVIERYEASKVVNPYYSPIFAEEMKIKYERYMNKNASINAKDKYGITPLQRVCLRGHINIARRLIEKGALNGVLIDEKEGNGFSALHCACIKGYLDIAHLLLDSGAAINQKSRGGQTPLHLASLWGHKELALALIARGADVKMRDDHGSTAEMMLAKFC